MEFFGREDTLRALAGTLACEAVRGCPARPRVDGLNGFRYHHQVIRSFRDRETEGLFKRTRARRLSPELQRTALRKLIVLDAAESLQDLRVPPGNRLESLKGERTGQHSIRINDQRRICFFWRTGDCFDVEIVDYH